MKNTGSSLTSKSHIFKKTIYPKNSSDLSPALSFCSKEKNPPVLLLGLEH